VAFSAHGSSGSQPTGSRAADATGPPPSPARDGVVGWELALALGRQLGLGRGARRSSPQLAAARSSSSSLLTWVGLGLGRGLGGEQDSSAPATYCDQKVANREIRVWHFVIENGY
jgi:hypothetical protein